MIAWTRLPATRSHHDLPESRGGLTVVELLVAIAIIGLLIALLLPAVQRVREASRRVTCTSHLRQLALAANQYESSYGRFPGRWARMPGAPQTFRTHFVSPQASLLPYLENGGLFETIRVPEMNSGADDEPPTSTVNSHLLDTAVEVLRCPSDHAASGSLNYRACRGTATSHYRPSRPAPDPLWGEPDIPRPGVFSHGPRKAADIRDGLSATAFFSERVIGDGDPSRYDPWRDVLRTPRFGTIWVSPNMLAGACAAANESSSPTNAPPRSYAGRTWLLSGSLHTLYNHILPPNSSIPDCGSDSWDIIPAAVSARSFHPGGVNVAFGDGSVRFASENIDLDVWRAESSFNGRD